MANAQSGDALRAALHFLATSEIPAEHKAVLIETVRERLRELENEGRRQAAQAQQDEHWQLHEVALISASLSGRVASSWQHADELLMSVAAQLHREAREVRVKATELGCGPAVDFRLAKVLRERAEQ